MLTSGVVLSERYLLDTRLGAGGMGDVWRATDLRLRRTVAVKTLLPALIADNEFAEQFFTEARTMAALRHPGIVNVYDFGKSALPDGSRAIYLVMECVDGEPLSKRIHAMGRLPVPLTMSIVAQVAQALQAAHDLGIVHRDVKPGNLLIAQDATVRLADFGVAGPAQDSSTQAHADSVHGTALYMAPEQAMGRTAGFPADVYALGAVAYHCLAGHPPFQGETPVEIALHHVQDAPPPLPADIPEPVRDLVFRALAKDPQQRFPSAAALATAALAAAARAATAAPDLEEPGVAVPGVAEPGVAVPGVAVPGVAVPGVAVPGVAVPGVAEPSVAVPGVAVPGVAVPGLAPVAGVGGVATAAGWATRTAGHRIRGAAAVNSPDPLHDTLTEPPLAMTRQPAPSRRGTTLAAAGAGLLLALLTLFVLSDVPDPPPSRTPGSTPTPAPALSEKENRAPSRTPRPSATPSRTTPAPTTPSATTGRPSSPTPSTSPPKSPTLSPPGKQ